jgi:hypothetical protein
MADQTGSDNPLSADLDERARRELLRQALGGGELGADDDRMVAWLADQDVAIVHGIVGMVERARLQERRATTRPLRGANLDDFLTLLEAVRDTLDAGRGDLAAVVLRLLLEHRGAMGKRSRTAAALLRSQLAERGPQRPSRRDEARGADL